jgi:hypothetical protein
VQVRRLAAHEQQAKQCADELRSGIGQLRLGDLDIAFRHEQLGLGNVLVALRLLAGLHRAGLSRGDQARRYIDQYQERTVSIPSRTAIVMLPGW